MFFFVCLEALISSNIKSADLFRASSGHFYKNKKGIQFLEMTDAAFYFVLIFDFEGPFGFRRLVPSATQKKNSQNFIFLMDVINDAEKLRKC